MKRIEPIVKELLELYPKTRDDDFYLIGSVYFMLAPEIKSKSFLDIIKNHSFYGGVDTSYKRKNDAERG